MIQYPSRIQLAQLPTPLQPLDRLSEQLKGPRIWIKRDDLTGSHLSGNKVRKLEFVLTDALEQGADTLITCGGTQSNHCRATAFVAAQYGLNCHLILRQDASPSTVSGDDLSDGNLLLDRLAGADVQIYPPSDFAKQLKPRVLELEQQVLAAGGKPYFIPVGASDGVGIWGYIAACEELKSDFAAQRIQPSHIISATGSGGTQAGLVAGAQLFALGAEVQGFAVCDSAAYFHRKIQSDIAEWQRRYRVAADVELKFNVQVNDRHIGPGYAQADDEVLSCIAELARLEGVLLDPVYTGKAFLGLIKEIQAGAYASPSDLVFVHTGGMYALFPWRERLQALL